MKKQAFGMVAVLFALMVALLAGAYAADAETAEPDAANTAYAILYEDGTLVFQNGATPEPERAVTKTYEVDLNAVYDDWSAYAPWYNERGSIRVVSFADKISPTSTAYWFFQCSELEHIDNIHNLDTADVTDMGVMFYGCNSLTALDVSHFNTAKVTSMSNMFLGCSALTVLDVSGWNTANITNMNMMFQGCSNLTTLDVSHFNTAKVESMCHMFENCGELTVLDVSHFDTSNVGDMGWMFTCCGRLTELDVSHFDTSNVVDMTCMFSCCTGLMKLDISRFNTAKVKRMAGMFDLCIGLTELDVSHFDTANVKNMDCMFDYCRGLTKLDISNFDTAKVNNMREMFSGCSNLKTIYISNKFTIASVEEISEYQGSQHMFLNCSALVGGNGTKYDESHTNKEYARIDTPSAPGYFTDVSAKPAALYAITAALTENGKLSVTLSNPAAVTVAVPYFDAKGKFVSVQLQDVPANAGTVSFALSADAKNARVMLLDSSYCPLCAAYAVALG